MSRKLKPKKSTEANLIHHLVEKGFNNCLCEATKLCDKILVMCTCDEPNKIDPVQEEKLEAESKLNRNRKRHD